jgi:ribosome-binding protein aMBF1 (putative translation factor)
VATLGISPAQNPWRPDGLRACVDCGLLKSRDDRAEIERGSRNWARRRVEARASADWSPGGYILGLQGARRAAGLSQRALAERAGLSSDTVGHLERAGYPARRLTITVLATALGIVVTELHISTSRPHV